MNFRQKGFRQKAQSNLVILLEIVYTEQRAE